MERLNIVKRIKIIFAVMAVFMFLSGLARAETRLSTTSDIANIRSGPSTSCDILWQVEQYHPVIIVEEKGNWCKIKDFENDIGWIHKSLLSKTKSIITIKNKCNVRSKPVKQSRILYTVERGVPFKTLDQEGNWIKIEHADGDVGWIYRTLVW